MRPSFLRHARVAGELFPTPASVLPVADPWCLPNDFIPATSRSAAKLAAVLTKKDYQTGWFLFTTHRQQFSTEMLSRLLSIVPSGSETAHLWWPRALQIKDAMMKPSKNQKEQRLINASARSLPLETGLNTADYAVLINLAANAGNLKEVESLWTEMKLRGIPRDTNVWNQYISAVCDANPQFWPWPRSRSQSYARRVSQKKAGTELTDANIVRQEAYVLSLLDRMEVENVSRNSRTFELVLLALAREGYAMNNPNIVQTLESLATRLWASENSNTPPTLSSLTAIVNSFALFSQLVAGCKLVEKITQINANAHGAKLGLSHAAAHQYWSRLLRLIVAQTEPRNNVPTEFFEQVWNQMIHEYRYTPSLGCQSIRMEFFEMKNQFDKMFAAIPEILQLTTQGTPHAQSVKLAQSAIHRATHGLANTNRAMDAVKQLQWVRSLGIEPPAELDAFLAEKGATLQQLQMFEEDDDEDNII